MTDAYPEALASAERERLARRRAAADLTAAATKPLVGLGLSGGGIRSATFALGFVQALAKHQLLRQVDYLSTVSGGGYLGSFLGRLFQRNSYADVAQLETGLSTQAQHNGALRYLRENGRYLAPNGAGDMLLGVTVVLRNLLSVHMVLGLFVLLLLLLTQLAYLLPAGLYAQLVGVSLAPSALVERLTTPFISPYLLLAALAAAFWLPATAWVYWLVGYPRHTSTRERLAHWGPPALVMGLALSHYIQPWVTLPNFAAILLYGAGLVAALSLALALYVHLRQRHVSTGVGGNGTDAAGKVGLARNRSSRWHRQALLVTLALVLLGLFDSLGGNLKLWLSEKTWSEILAGLGAVIATLSAARVWITKFVPQTGERPRLPVTLLAGAIALALLALYFLLLATLAHALAQGHGVYALVALDLNPLWIGLALGVLVFLLGNALAFVNRSGHHALYKARLTRAYLGASNPARHSGSQRASVLDTHPDDDTSLQDYFATGSATGALHQAAPLHLINVTVNETVDGQSQVQQQDRKGSNLAFGPCGMSLGVRHHAIFAGDKVYAPSADLQLAPSADRFRVFAYPEAQWQAEPLSLGSLVAISGAAFSTGIGARTNFFLSLLCGLANVRLGYWWDSGVAPGSRQHARHIARWRRALAHYLPVYSFLLAELLARFRGPSWQHWYLSDGGHFENMGGYELIRRQLPLTLIVDAEADPDYTYDGLGDLVRKARLDFGAEIEFLHEAELRELGVWPLIGTLDSLRRYPRPQPAVTVAGAPASPPLSQSHAALARVKFADGSSGWLLYVKPTLTGAEPADLQEYLASHPAFPHEPTIDQFFDENQWESYRRLGQHIGELLCSQGADGWDLAQRLRDTQRD